MKKNILTLFTLVWIVVGSFGQSISTNSSGLVKDRVRISYFGFNCNTATQDNTLEMDGKGDEIFVLCNWLMADKNNNLEFSGKYRSPLHGDINGHNGWIKVGSRSDKGGITSGDQYRCNTAIGEFEISDGEVFTMTPTIWEWDGNDEAYNNFQVHQTNHVNELKNVASQFSKGFALLGDPVNTTIVLVNQMKTTISLFSMAINDILSQAKDRPIGMETNGRFSPKSIVLTRDMMRKIAQRNLGYGLGVLQVDYDEIQLGNTRDHGAYTVLIKVEYLGSSSTAPTGGTYQPSNNTTPVSTTPRYVPPPSTSNNTTPASTTPRYVPPPSTSNNNAPASNPPRYVPPPSTSNNTTPASTPPRYVPPATSSNPAQSSGGVYHPNIPPANNPQAGNGGAVALPSAGNANMPSTGGPKKAMDGVYAVKFYYLQKPISPLNVYFQFFSNGTMTYLTDLNRFIGSENGTYMLGNNNQLQLRHSAPAAQGHYYSYVGTLNGNQISGTWGNDASTTNGGTWFAIRK